MSCWSVQIFWVLLYLGKRKTLLTAVLFTRHPRPGSDINYFLPKPIKPLIRWVLSPGPIMEINWEKSPRPFENLPLILSRSQKVIDCHNPFCAAWSLTSLSFVSPLTQTPRPAGDSVRPPESEQLLPCEAGWETESRFTEAGTKSHRGKSWCGAHTGAHRDPWSNMWR